MNLTICMQASPCPILDRFSCMRSINWLVLDSRGLHSNFKHWTQTKQLSDYMFNSVPRWCAILVLLVSSSVPKYTWTKRYGAPNTKPSGEHSIKSTTIYIDPIYCGLITHTSPMPNPLLDKISRWNWPKFQNRFFTVRITPKTPILHPFEIIHLLNPFVLPTLSSCELYHSTCTHQKVRIDVGSEVTSPMNSTKCFVTRYDGFV